jgi:hypothetical protein
LNDGPADEDQPPPNGGTPHPLPALMPQVNAPQQNAPWWQNNAIPAMQVNAPVGLNNQVNDIGQNLQVIWPAPQQHAPPFPQHDDGFIEINDFLNPMNEDIAQVADNNDANIVDEDDSSITLTISSGSGLPSAGSNLSVNGLQEQLDQIHALEIQLQQAPHVQPILPDVLAVDLNVIPPDANIFLINDAPIDQNVENIENQPDAQPELDIANLILPNNVINNDPQPMEIQFDQPNNNIYVGQMLLPAVAADPGLVAFSANLSCREGLAAWESYFKPDAASDGNVVIPSHWVKFFHCQTALSRRFPMG